MGKEDKGGHFEGCSKQDEDPNLSANFVLVEHLEHVLRARTIHHAKNDVLSISVLPVPNIWFGTKTMSNKSLLSKCCGYCC